MDNASLLEPLARAAAGLKMYLNDTFSNLRMDDVSLWMEVSHRRRGLPWGWTQFLVLVLTNSVPP